MRFWRGWGRKKSVTGKKSGLMFTKRKSTREGVLSARMTKGREKPEKKKRYLLASNTSGEGSWLITLVGKKTEQKRRKKGIYKGGRGNLTSGEVHAG